MALKKLPSNLLCYLLFNRQSRLDDEIKNTFLTLRWMEKQDMFYLMHLIKLIDFVVLFHC